MLHLFGRNKPTRGGFWRIYIRYTASFNAEPFSRRDVWRNLVRFGYRQYYRSTRDFLLLSFHNMSLANKAFPKMNLPPVSCQGDFDPKIIHKSPTSVSALETDVAHVGKEPGSKRFDQNSKIKKCVSPTTRFMQNSEFRSESPTDQNRLGSPNGLLRKKYMTCFRKENPPLA